MLPFDHNFAIFSVPYHKEDCLKVKMICHIPVVHPLFLIQELMVVLYPPRGPLIPTVPWGGTTPVAFRNVGWIQRFMEGSPKCHGTQN